MIKESKCYNFRMPFEDAKVITTEVVHGPSGGVRALTRYIVDVCSIALCVDVGSGTIGEIKWIGGDPKLVVEVFVNELVQRGRNPSDRQIVKLPALDARRIAKSLRTWSYFGTKLPNPGRRTVPHLDNMPTKLPVMHYPDQASVSPSRKRLPNTVATLQRGLTTEISQRLSAQCNSCARPRLYQIGH